MNEEIFRWINSGAGSRPLIDFLGVAAAQVTPYLVFIVMALLWLRSANRGKRVLLEAGAVVFFSLAVDQLIAAVYFHPRPFMVGLCTPLIHHAPESSFPSDHATLLFAASLALMARAGWRVWGGILFIIALTGAWGRVYTGVHFPFDVGGSFLVALVGVAVLALLRSPLTPVYSLVINGVNRLQDMLLGGVGLGCREDMEDR